MSLTKWSWRAMPAPASKIEEWVKVVGDKLVLCSPRCPLGSTLMLPFHLDVIISDSFLQMTVQIHDQHIVAGDTEGYALVLPFSSRMTLPTALSVPEARMMSWAAPQPSWHGFWGAITVFWWQRWHGLWPCHLIMPKLSWVTLAKGARQLVREALLTILRKSYFSWFTPITNMGAPCLNVLFRWVFCLCCWKIPKWFSWMYFASQQVIIDPVLAEEPYPTQVKLFY